jgi:ketol-acid reductoisomerase
MPIPKIETRGLTMPGGTEGIIVSPSNIEERNQLVQGLFERNGVGTVAVIGWSSQGPAHAQNLRDTLTGSGTKVVVGLRETSGSVNEAESLGFDVLRPTEAAAAGDLVLGLISDKGMVDIHQSLIGAMRDGDTFGLAHGFLPGYLQTVGSSLEEINPGIGYGMVAPKGMGPSVRRLYEQGSGINSSYAVETSAAHRGKTLEVITAWGLGIGSPFLFETSMGNERKSDIFGERAILLGGVDGIVTAAYEYHKSNGCSGEEAFLRSVESITGPISKAISEGGLIEVLNRVPESERPKLIEVYDLTYPKMLSLMDEIYRDVSSGREIGSVIDGTDRVERDGWTNVAATPMWQNDGNAVRNNREVTETNTAIDPITAGLYLAGMVAQADTLERSGHRWSEIANETVIEAVDSLNPYMHARGLDFLVDNCSTTARLGDRKWAPRFKAVIEQGVFPEIGNNHNTEETPFSRFYNHPLHQALEVCSALRPDIDIAVS